MIVNCIVCNKEINVKPSRIKRLKISDGICCSNKCRNENRKKIYLGNNNPNIRYRYDRNLFKNIDTEEKAYILGFIAADGSIFNNRISIYIDKIDISLLEKMKNVICEEIEIKKRKNTTLVGIEISSKEMSDDICNHLKIKQGKKAGVVGYPDLDVDLNVHFIRGLLDGDGYIRRTNGRDHPECGITNTSDDLLEGIINNIDSKLKKYKDRVSVSGINALDFMSLLYDNSSIHLNRKFYRYLDWASYLPGLSGRGNYKDFIKFRIVKTQKEAAMPFKKRASDCGYDLTCIRKIEEKSDENVHWYGTGIKIKPKYGWYVDVVPRSSIHKYGYVLHNSIGVIDRGYSGEILAPMMKVDKTKPDPKLPVRMLQIIPRMAVHVKFEVVDSFDEETIRGTGGFGSTGI